jgi:ribosome-associated translation inhibitor RaiA
MHLKLRMNPAHIEQVLRNHIERRLRFALGRFGERVGNVSVTLAGPEGRSGESRCRIRIEVVPRGSFAVEERGHDLLAAIDRAAGRVGRLFGREIERAREAYITRDSIRLRAA